MAACGPRDPWGYEESRRLLQDALSGFGWKELAKSPLYPGRTAKDLGNRWGNHFMRSELSKRPEQVAEVSRHARACGVRVLCLGQS